MSVNLLLLENEPLILMDLEFAGEESGCRVWTATSCDEALEIIKGDAAIDVAVLDVTLDEGCTCLPVAENLETKGIPYLLHSGDLDRHEERVRTLKAPLIAKPAATEEVIAAAIALVGDEGSDDLDQTASYRRT